MLSENKTIFNIVQLEKKCTLVWLLFYYLCILQRGDKKTVEYAQEEKIFKKIEILG